MFTYGYVSGGSKKTIHDNRVKRRVQAKHWRHSCQHCKGQTCRIKNQTEMGKLLEHSRLYVFCSWFFMMDKWNHVNLSRCALACPPFHPTPTWNPTFVLTESRLWQFSLLSPLCQGCIFSCFILFQLNIRVESLDWCSQNLVLMPKGQLCLQWGVLRVLWRPLFSDELLAHVTPPPLTLTPFQVPVLIPLPGSFCWQLSSLRAVFLGPYLSTEPSLVTSHGTQLSHALPQETLEA